MYELIILSLLMRIPAHGYLIAHILNAIIGPYARISSGRLYPLLARLEESRLIAFDEEAARAQRGERIARHYRITEAGRKRFHVLMMDTTSNPGEYQRIFHQKVPMFFFLTDAERLYLIDHYINYCQAHILHLVAEGEDLARGNYHRYEGDQWVMPATLDIMKHMADQWRLEVAWAQSLREQQPAYRCVSDRPTEHGGDNQNQNENQNKSQNSNWDKN